MTIYPPTYWGTPLNWTRAWLNVKRWSNNFLTCGQLGFRCQILSAKFSLTSTKLENLFILIFPLRINHRKAQNVAKVWIQWQVHIYFCLWGICEIASFSFFIQASDVKGSGANLDVRSKKKGYGNSLALCRERHNPKMLQIKINLKRQII